MTAPEPSQSRSRVANGDVLQKLRYDKDIAPDLIRGVPGLNTRREQAFWPKLVRLILYMRTTQNRQTPLPHTLLAIQHSSHIVTGWQSVYGVVTWPHAENPGIVVRFLVKTNSSCLFKAQRPALRPTQSSIQ